MGELDSHNPANHRRARASNPKGYEPGVELTDTGGTGVAAFTAEQVPNGVPDDDWLIDGFGLDPDEWAIADGTLQVRKWMRYDGLWLHYFKVGLVRRHPATRELLASIAARVDSRPNIRKKRPAPDGAFVVLATDLQIGKGEGGGTEAFLYRFADSVDAAVNRWRHLAGSRWKLPDVALMLGGDTCEGVSGNYAAQPFNVDLCQRDQLEIAALSIDYLVDSFVDAGAARIVLAGVPSNHGENRSGKSIATSPRDSTDLIVLDQLRRAYSKSARYSHVDVVVPDGDHTTMCLDLAGTPVGLAHAHQTGRKSVADWWKAQMPDPGRPLSRARVLFVGHRHHLHIQDVADDRLLIQGPAMDGGSPWFADLAGEDQSPGMLTCVVADGGAHDIELIRLTPRA